VLRDLLTILFFIKQLLVLLDIRISIFFEFLFSRSYIYVFVSDSQVYLPPESHDSPVKSSLGVSTTR
jgi:hypothetical protein